MILALTILNCLSTSYQDFQATLADQGLKVSVVSILILLFLSKHFILGSIICFAAQSLNQQWHLVALGKKGLRNSGQDLPEYALKVGHLLRRSA